MMMIPVSEFEWRAMLRGGIRFALPLSQQRHADVIDIAVEKIFGRGCCEISCQDEEADMNAREHIWADAMRAERRGDAAAYERLLGEIAGMLRVVIRSRLSRRGAATYDEEDIVQEVLIGLHTMRRRWDETRPFMPWLHAIVRYKLADAARRRKGEAILRDDLSFEAWCNIADAPSDRGGADLLDASRALSRLPAGQRDVVVALAIDGASVRETAEKLETTEGTVRMTFHRALQRLAAAARSETPSARNAKP
jgi:RNA polymerase sigma factor (sigma-70 family)